MANKCVACPRGTQRPAGDNPVGADTECACRENFRVKGDQCVKCESRYQTRPAGDLVSNGDTQCLRPCERDGRPGCALCEENYHVVNYTCVQCADGGTSEPGDDPGRSDTKCYPAGTCGGVTCDADGTLAGDAGC